MDKVVVTMSVTPTLPGQKISAQLFWNDRQNRSFTERMSVIFPVEGDGRPHRYTIPLADNPDFVLPFREIVQLRFDPMDSPGKLTLDDFQIVPFPRE